MTDNVMTNEEFPFGLRCAECDVIIEEGELFSSKLEGFIGEVPMTVITCVQCAMSVGA